MATNLLEACADGNVEMVRKLCADWRNLSQRDNNRWYPIHHAVISKNTECLKVLLSCRHIDVKVTTDERETPLFLACAQPGMPLEIVQMLHYRHHPLGNTTNKRGITPLHMAVHSGLLDIVKFLVEAFPRRINWIDSNAEHPLFYAVRNMNLEMVEYLTSHPECNITHQNSAGVDALQLVARYRSRTGNAKRKLCLKYLLQGMDRKTKLTFGQVEPVIGDAISWKDVDVMDAILEVFHLSRDHNKPKYIELVQDILHASTGAEMDIISYNYRILCLLLHKTYTKRTKSDFWRHVGQCCSALFHLSRNHFNLFQKYGQALRQAFVEPITLEASFFNEWINQCNDANMDLAYLYDFLWQLVKQGYDIDASDYFHSNCITADLREQRQTLSEFRKRHNFRLTLFAPFSTSVQPFLDDNVTQYFSGARFPETGDICTDAYHFGEPGTSVPKLLYMCRAVIRRAVFSANASQHVKMVKLYSLDVPLTVKNVLFYNSGNYKILFD